MQELFAILPEIANAMAHVLICGESGTGKELIARSLHELSPRGGKPFVAVNCAALPDTLLESELLGTVPGPSPTLKKTNPASFPLLKAERYFLMRSAISRRPCRQSCCGCSRKRFTNRWAASHRKRRRPCPCRYEQGPGRYGEKGYLP